MKKIYLSLFLVSLSTLLLEITLTRVYSVLFFYNYAFMIVSSALFGYGISAVWLLIFSTKFKEEFILKLSPLFFAIAIFLLLLGLIFVPLSFSKYKILYRFILLTFHYFILILPFFFSGLFIASIFTKYTADIAKLYFFDLIGASLGSLILLFLIPKIGASGLFFLSILFSLISSAIIGENKFHKRIIIIIILLIIPFLIYSEKIIKFQPHLSKMGYIYYLKHKNIIYDKWSSVSKIDVAVSEPLWIIWIDGGTNISHMPIPISNASIGLAYKDITSIPYKIIKEPKALIIGPGGGWEVAIAKNLKAKKITAVEMDKTIVDIVKNKFNKEMNYLFSDKAINLIANEGRSFIYTSQEKYDIIQQINNQTSISIASGALNLSETFLLTKEALSLYWDHLTDRGILSIWKWGIERMFSTAIIFLKEKGYPQPQSHIFVIKHPDFYQRLFLLKKQPFSKNEIEIIEKMCKENHWEILYNPKKNSKGSLFDLMLSEEDIKNISEKTGINLMPATDDKPFFNHLMPLWKKKIERKPYLAPDLINMIENVSKTERTTLGIILLQGLFFSILFLFFPLVKFAKEGIYSKLSLLNILYFSCLGMGFIIIEIILMQKFVLYLGHPSYSISIILFSLLISAGLGSFFSGKFINKIGESAFSNYLFIVLLLVILIFLTLIDLLIKRTIGFNIVLKGIISFLMISSLGFLLGMPFPTGLFIINKISNKIIPWSWGINSYMTIIGSVLAVILAISFGFKFTFICAFIFYLISFFSLKRIIIH